VRLLSKILAENSHLKTQSLYVRIISSEF